MRAPLLLIPAVLLAGVASPALAFDCAKARTPLEKTICADPAARQADDAMGAAYIAVQAASGKAESQALLRNQRAWLQRRQSVCRDWSQTEPVFDGACLARETRARGRLLAGYAEHEGPGALRFRPTFSERIDPKRKVEVSIAVPQLAAGAEPAPGLDALLGATAGAADDPADDDPRYSYDAGYAITYNSGELVSVVFDIYVDHGGAHGQGVQAAANYSPALGRALKVDDLGHRRPDRALPRPAAAGEAEARRHTRHGRRRPDRAGGGRRHPFDRGLAVPRRRRRHPLRRLCHRRLCRGAV
nr:lysozyme inhibitor LprI family protein [Inquilinus limosus]